MPAKPLPPAELLRSLYDYNPETGALTNRHNGRTLSAKRRIIVQIDKELFNGTRIIWKWMTGEDPPHLVDHANLDPGNNRWVNLRAATYGQNSQNRTVTRRSLSGLKGVKRIPAKGNQPITWQACIRYGGAHKYLGSFATPEEAHEAYKLAAAELHGGFARW